MEGLFYWWFYDSFGSCLPRIYRLDNNEYSYSILDIRHLRSNPFFLKFHTRIVHKHYGLCLRTSSLPGMDQKYMISKGRHVIINNKVTRWLLTLANSLRCGKNWKLWKCTGLLLWQSYLQTNHGCRKREEKKVTQNFTSQVLNMNPLPSIDNVYNMIICEEQYCVIARNQDTRAKAVAFAAWISDKLGIICTVFVTNLATPP